VSKRAVTVPAILILFCMLLSPPVMGQSKEQGIKLYNQALSIQEKARSTEDLKKSAEKYQEALNVFQRAGFQEGIGWVANNLGNIYRGWGQYPTAVEYFKKSLDIRRKIKDAKGEAGALNNLGLVHENWGEFIKAGEYYEMSRQIRRRIGDARAEADSLNNLGTVHRRLGEYSKAAEYYEKSAEIYRKHGDASGESYPLTGLGNVYKDRAQYPEAAQYYEKSLRIKKKLGDIKGEGDILNNLGTLYYFWAQYPRAVDYYEKSLQIKIKIGDIKGEGNALHNIGAVYQIWSQYSKAEEYYQRSLQIKSKIGDVSGEADSLICMGNIYKNSGQYSKAVEYYEKSLQIKGKVGDVRGEADALGSLALVYQDWGQYSKAVEYQDKCLEIRRRIGDRRGEADTLGNLGFIYASWGQYSKAEEYYNQDLEIARKIGNIRGEGLIFMNLGSFQLHRREYGNALMDFQKALSIHKQIGVPLDGPKRLIGELYLDMNDAANAEPFLKEAGESSSLARLHLFKLEYEPARDYYAKLLKSAQESFNVNDLFIANTGLGTVFEGTGENLKAGEHYLKAVQLIEQLRTGLSRSEREQFFDVRVGGFYRTSPYKGLARVLMRMKKPLDAFQRSEYTKARVFAESLSRWSEGATFDVPPEILKEDAEINDRISALKKSRQKAYEGGNKQVIEALDPQIKELETKFDAHVKALRDKHALFAATKYPEPMDLGQAALDENEWLLAYDVSDSGVLIYLIKGKQLVRSLFKPISATQLEDLVQKFRRGVEIGMKESIVEKIKSFDFASGKKCADFLLADLLPDLPINAPLIIVPDGCLGVVPFEMLVLNEGGSTRTGKPIPYVTDAEFFGDRNPISYYQSLTALSLVRTLRTRKKSGERTLAMVDPIFATDDARFVKTTSEERRALLDKLTGERLMSFRSDLGLTFPRLPTTGELGQLLKTADPANTDLYDGFKAQKTVLLQMDLTKYRACVLATHGYYGKDLPGIQEPVLIFTLPGQAAGRDGFLRMTEVMGLKINSELVALTACQTGLGKQISGEGIMGMGRAFQYAGARSVLMSLWTVAETSSVQLVENFFRHMKEGKNKLEALKLAREEIRKNGYDHPFFWAPFILVGEVD
jgi:tetratricopeptide (TPR) repeat protein